MLGIVWNARVPLPSRGDVLCGGWDDQRGFKIERMLPQPASGCLLTSTVRRIFVGRVRDRLPGSFLIVRRNRISRICRRRGHRSVED